MYKRQIINCNAEIIIDTIKSGFIPVISSIGFDKDSNTYNINADTVASEIASKIGAEAVSYTHLDVYKRQELFK